MVAPASIPSGFVSCSGSVSAAGGTHDDWDAYDRAMAEERRTAVLVSVSRIYSN